MECFEVALLIYEIFAVTNIWLCPQYTEHLLLIGDHDQLRPKPNVYELQAESGR